MEVGKVLRPGDKGTKRILNTYGKNLICVRYRYDKKNKKRFTTAEIIIDEKPWFYCPTEKNRPIEPVCVSIRVAYEEIELRARIKKLGGRWNPHRKAWDIDLHIVEQLQLEDRIVQARD